MPTASSRGAKVRFLPLLGLLFSIAIVVLACGSTSDNTGATTTGSTSASTSSAQHFKVGDQVKVGSTWVVTVNSAQTHGATDMDQPKSGDTYLVVDATFKNVASTEQDLSTLLQLSLKDSTGQKYDETVTTFAQQPPDGKVAAGDVVRGQVVYEVPSAQKSFTLAFESDIVSSGQVIWDINL
ncbi:MAG TPA: DUF4352 domain-containing protein [Ktedonobacterales bacterium]|jgi:hypothetical protein